MRLTARNVLTLDHGEHRDAVVPGLILRVWETGRAWSFRYTYAGQRARVDLGPLERDPEKIGANIEQTRDLARLLVAGLVRGEDPRVTLRRHESDALTVAKLCERAIASIKLRPATRAGWEGHLRRDIAPELGEIPAASLSRDRIRQWGKKISARSGYSANRAFECARRAFSFGVEEGILIASPFVRIPKPFSDEKPREYVMTVDDLVGLVQTLDAEPCGYSNAVELLLLTGVRKSEVRGAMLAEFSGDMWTVSGSRTKSGVDHVIPLSRQALAVVERQRATVRSRYLFPRVHIRRIGDAPKSQSFRLGSHYVKRLRATVAGGPWTLHGFRHAIATYGQDVLGIELSVISAILGHVTPEISKATRIYARGKQLDARRAALQDWADWLDSLRWNPRRGPKVAQ